MMPIDFVRDWAAHSGEPEDAVRARVRNAIPLVCAEWEGFFPNGARPTAQQARRFYEQSLVNIYEMIGWAGRVQKDSWPEECGQRLRENGCRTVLDFGCGLGQIGLALAGMGFEVTLAELFGSRHYPFLFRLAARVPGVRIRQTEVALADDDEGPWDAIICMEVFEHLACPDLMIRRLLAKLRPGGILFASWSFWPEGTTDTTRWPLHLQNGWTDERFEAFAERVCGLKWLNPGPCWHRILRKET